MRKIGNPVSSISLIKVVLSIQVNEKSFDLKQKRGNIGMV